MTTVSPTEEVNLHRFIKALRKVWDESDLEIDDRQMMVCALLIEKAEEKVGSDMQACFLEVVASLSYVTNMHLEISAMEYEAAQKEDQTDDPTMH